MAVQRFVLDSTTLDNAGFGLAGGAAFILNTSTLDGTAVLDGGQFLTPATGSSSLGGVSGSATAFKTVQAVGSSSLGGLFAIAPASSTVNAIASSSLGGVSAAASATITKFAVLSAPLGGLVGSANVGVFAVLSAPLDGLVASATATVIPPAPPEEPSSGGNWYQPRRRPVKKELPPEQIIIEIPQPRRPVLVSAVCGSRLGGLDVAALGSVTFSLLDDDAEVLLLI
jgi:hypothetical protein